MEHGRSSVLIVDDRTENLVALEAVLEPLAARVVQASSGEDCLRTLLRHEVAVIILDVHMPGLDGFQTAELIRNRRKTRDIPIIFLTAYGDELRHRGYESGAVDYIVKPFEPELLRAKVSVFLDLHAKNRLLREQTFQLHNRLTELQAAQRSLAAQAAELARSNTALERFVQVVSHDLREPLRTLSGFVELLDERAGDDDPEIRLYAARARANAERMLSHIDELLRSARASDEGLNPVATDLAEVTHAVADDLGFAIRASGGRVTHADLPKVWADPARLAQVMQNLISNALKFRGSDPPEIVIDAELQERTWVVRVHDNGIGVPPEQRERIFTMFHRFGQAEGSGIGLAVCRRIIEAHGGRIWVESQGEGSTFAFTIPAVPEDSRTSTARADSPSGKTASVAS